MLLGFFFEKNRVFFDLRFFVVAGAKVIPSYAQL